MVVYCIYSAAWKFVNPLQICGNVSNFNACYFLFSTVLSKIFYIKDDYI